MADPILVKLLAEAALQAAKDKESRNRLIAIILGPVIFRTGVGQMNHTDRTRSAPMAAVLPA